MKSKLLEKISIEIPLDTRLEMAIKAHFIHEGGGQFFIPADETYIPEGDTIPLVEQIMNKNAECIAKAQPIIDIIRRELDRWVEDGGIIQLKYSEEEE